LTIWLICSEWIWSALCCFSTDSCFFNSSCFFFFFVTLITRPDSAFNFSNLIVCIRSLNWPALVIFWVSFTFTCSGVGFWIILTEAFLVGGFTFGGVWEIISIFGVSTIFAVNLSDQVRGLDSQSLLGFNTSLVVFSGEIFSIVFISVIKDWFGTSSSDLLEVPFIWFILICDCSIFSNNFLNKSWEVLSNCIALLHDSEEKSSSHNEKSSDTLLLNASLFLANNWDDTWVLLVCLLGEGITLVKDPDLGLGFAVGIATGVVNFRGDFGTVVTLLLEIFGNNLVEGASLGTRHFIKFLTFLSGVNVSLFFL